MKPHAETINSPRTTRGRRPAVVTACLAIACLVAVIVSIGLGDIRISPIEVVKSIFGQGSPADMLVVQQLRLPRITVAMLVGASLAASGAMLQGMTRNPLASPEMMGITGGATVAAVAFLTFSAGTISIRYLPFAALAGAAAVSLLVYLLAWKKGISPIRLITVGVGIASLTSAMTTAMIVFSPINDPSQAFLWITGSVYGSNWENVATLLPWTAILLPASYLFHRTINVQQLGDEISIALGSSLQWSRLLILLSSVALAGSAVSVAGGIGFVGLIAPHMARKLVGSRFEHMFPVSALLGAILVVLADLVGRTVFLPRDVPAGVFTAAIGAPFFIYLLYASRKVK
ncbi:FecCD family ABC transporter permease [Paenibacillus sp. NEAU-GSW1]|uniref:FecCD family ABC transporter permease n=1 Tax=Paenibacillus sp. NEAU-GSW1 TaxID=2682486 RepID=UPI00139B237B|nr:iron chelate uptake ABC transporter family permease subunit [Paenibacillus sp. NEAU-GSW1]